MDKKTTPTWPILAFAIMLLVIGLAIFGLPFLIEGQADNTELQERTSGIGGAIMGVGAVVFLIYLFKRKK